MFNKLYNGNALEIIKEIKNNSIDLIIIDPPYNIYEGGAGIYKKRDKKNVMKMAQENKLFIDVPEIKDYINILYSKLKNNAHCYIMTNSSNLYLFMNEICKSKFKLAQILIWEKSIKILNPYFSVNHEYILLIRKGYKKISNYNYSTVIKIPFKKKHHPTEKPVRLMEILIESSSEINDIVLDCFMGAGSTGIASVRNKRSFIGIEIEKKYFNLAKKRIEEYQGVLI